MLNPFVGGFAVGTMEKATQAICDLADVVKEKGTSLCYCLGIGLLRDGVTLVPDGTLSDGAVHLDGMNEVLRVVRRDGEVVKVGDECLARQ